MKIDCNNTPSFGAKLISNKQEIGKFVKSSYKQTPISFVKIEPQNTGDINALEQVAKNWLYGKFASNVYHAACAVRNDSKYYKNNEIYALTSQNSDFENLDDKKILGLVHTAKFADGDLFIEHFESNPEIIYSRSPEYKGAGTAMLNSLKEFCHKLSCFPACSKYVKDFYYKNGFIQYPDGSNSFVWYKQLDI